MNAIYRLIVYSTSILTQTGKSPLSFSKDHIECISWAIFHVIYFQRPNQILELKEIKT